MSISPQTKGLSSYDFFQKHLQAFVDTSKTPWRWRSAGEVSLGIAPGVLVEFQRAAVIRDTFFLSGGSTPMVRFDLKPLTMDKAIHQFLLDLDGQIVTYSHDPTRPINLQWPGPNPSRQVRIQFSPPSATGRSGLVEEGPWAWFRLLDRASIRSTSQPTRFEITFDLDGHRASFELWANSVLNPFCLRRSSNSIAQRGCNPPC